jgi:hypothetical protein
LGGPSFKIPKSAKKDNKFCFEIFSRGTVESNEKVAKVHARKVTNKKVRKNLSFSTIIADCQRFWLIPFVGDLFGNFSNGIDNSFFSTNFNISMNFLRKNSLLPSLNLDNASKMAKKRKMAFRNVSSI